MPFNGSTLSTDNLAAPHGIYSPHFQAVASLARSCAFWCPARVLFVKRMSVFAVSSSALPRAVGFAAKGKARQVI